MRTEVVEYTGPGLPSGPARLTVSEATVLMRMRRDRLRLDGQRAIEPDEDRRVLRIYSYPDAVASVTHAEGLSWPPDFETFLGLPDGLLAALEAAIYRLNPHWLPEGIVTEDPKAPAPASTGDLPSG